MKKSLSAIYVAGDTSTIDIVLGAKDFEDFLDYYDSFECKSVPVKAPEQIGIDTDLSEILFYCRIPFEKVDMDEVRSIFQEWTEAPLSVETRRELDREDEDVKQHEW